jgi:hypothetical protein
MIDNRISELERITMKGMLTHRSSLLFLGAHVTTPAVKDIDVKSAKEIPNLT